jgi:hypothetical protein
MAFETLKKSLSCLSLSILYNVTLIHRVQYCDLENANSRVFHKVHIYRNHYHHNMKAENLITTTIFTN